MKNPESFENVVHHMHNIALWIAAKLNHSVYTIGYNLQASDL